MPIPYMGSKRKSAQKIYQTIINFNPIKGTIVDLFCGGFAIGEKFLENGWNVIANDKNKYITALLKESIKGLDEKIVTKFVTRENYFDALKNKEKHPDWYIGFLVSIWSFGNNQRSYLFGKDVEPIKHAAHDLVINKDASGVKDLIPQKYIDGILKQSDWGKRRMALVKVSGAIQKRIFELQHLEQLERLQRLQRLQQLELHSKGYDEIHIPKDAIIYCDPPYKGMAEYEEGSFNHDAFWDWAIQISKTNKIYVSEYSAPKVFISLLSFNQKSTLQGGTQKHNNQPRENLFIPIGQEKYRKSERQGI